MVDPAQLVAKENQENQDRMLPIANAQENRNKRKRSEKEKNISQFAIFLGFLVFGLLIFYVDSKKFNLSINIQSFTICLIVRAFELQEVHE